MRKLIEALQYLLKFMKTPDEPCVSCEHDIMRIWEIDVESMTLDDVKKLDAFGFMVGDAEFDDYKIDDGKICDEDGNPIELYGWDEDISVTEEQWNRIRESLSSCVSSYKYGSC